MLKDIFVNSKIFVSWNLDHAFIIEREFLKIIHHFEIIKSQLRV